MHQLNYALVPERSSDVPVYRKGWRPIKPRYKPYARPAAGIGAAALTTKRRLHKDIRPRAPAVTHQDVGKMDVDPAPWAHNFEIPAVRHHPEIPADAPKARSALCVCGMGFPTPVLETPAATHQEPIVQIDVGPAPRARNIEIPAGNILYPDPARGRPGISTDAPKAKWGGWGSMFDSPDFETPAATRQRMRPWHILYPDPVRGRPETSANAPKARSAWGGRGSAYDSPVLESRSVSHRKRKAHEESAAHPKAKKARIVLPAPSAESSPISSRKAEKSRVRDKPVDVPPRSLRKMEKARARNDSAESVDATSSTCSKTVKESCLPAPIYRPIMAANMTSSSKVKLEDIPLPADVGKATAVISFSPLALVTNVQDNNTSLTLNTPIKNPVFPPYDPTIVTSRKLGNSNDVPDIILFEDDYVYLPPIIDVPGIIMFEDDYVGLPPFIAGYVPEYGDYMQLDPVGAPDEVILFNTAPLAAQAIHDYVSEPMDIEWVGPSVPSGNCLGNVEAHPPHAGPPVMVENPIAEFPFNHIHIQPDPNAFPTHAGIVDPPYDPREPLLGPRLPVPSYHVQLPAPELNAPAIIPVQEESIGHVDDHAELFDELFGDGREEEDEEAKEGAGVLDHDEEDEEEVEIIS